MGRFTAKYSDQERGAVIRALLDDGRTAPEVVRMAARGRLAGLAPFSMPVATAYWLVRRERQRREREEREALLHSESLGAMHERVTRTLLRILRMEAARLLRHDGFAHTPDLLVNSVYDPDKDEVAAFEELVGSHGGLGGPQAHPFAIVPSDWETVEEPIVGAAAMHAALKRWTNRPAMGRRLI